MAAIATLCLSLCSLVFVLAVSPQERVDANQLRRIVDESSYEFTNPDIYRDQQKWIGRRISFRGSLVARPVVVPGGKLYEQISGTNMNGDPVNVVAFLDKPFWKPESYGQTGQIIARGNMYRFFGVIDKCSDYVDHSGYVRRLPTIYLLLVFSDDDREYERPLWVSQALR